jgi:hypothetical protein
VDLPLIRSSRTSPSGPPGILGGTFDVERIIVANRDQPSGLVVAAASLGAVGEDDPFGARGSRAILEAGGATEGVDDRGDGPAVVVLEGEQGLALDLHRHQAALIVVAIDQVLAIRIAHATQSPLVAIGQVEATEGAAVDRRGSLLAVVLEGADKTARVPERGQLTETVEAVLGAATLGRGHDIAFVLPVEPGGVSPAIGEVQARAIPVPDLDAGDVQLIEDRFLRPPDAVGAQRVDLVLPDHESHRGITSNLGAIGWESAAFDTRVPRRSHLGAVATP